MDTKVYGKSKLTHDVDKGDDLEFRYDATGNRIVKIVKPHADGGQVANQDKWKYTYYLHDASGNTMAVYTKDYKDLGTNSYKEALSISDFHLYGSDRLGTYTPKEDDKQVAERTFAVSNINTAGEFEEGTSTATSLQIVQVDTLSHYIGNKSYEGKNHLGNVLVVFTDAKDAFDKNNDGVTDFYEALVVSANDYYPFGSPMPNRKFSGVSYRYGFNGHEKDDEVSGSGNTVDMGDRWLDVRLGRTSKPDAHASSYPSVSPYSYALNNPLIYTDPDGKDVILVIWATANGEVGHAGIAVSNYKAVQREIEVRVPAIHPGSKGPDGYATTETHIITEYVPDGTYTYYDNWPDQGVNLGGIKGAIQTVDAYRSADIGQNGVIISDISDFTSGNITATYPYDPSTNSGIPGEAHMQDGVVRLETGYETDQQVKATLEGLNQTKPTYNGKGFNCSTYASCGLENVLGEKLGKENVLGPLKSVTPNQLWKDVLKAAGEQGVKADVLVDPGNKVDNSFKEGIGR